MIGGHPLSGILQGADYSVGRLSGWWQRPAVKRAAIARELADGDFPISWNYEARYIGIDGRVKTKSHEQMHHIMDQLNGICAVNREWLTIQGHGGTQSALVEADESPYVYPITDKIFRFELRFKANDPRKYGQHYEEFIGQADRTYRNFGNYPATPILDINAFGADSGFIVEAVIDGVTRRWEYLRSTSSSEVHRIDMRTGQHFVDGVERPDRLGRSQLWAIPPHKQVEARVFPVTSGNTNGFVSWRDTWI